MDALDTDSRACETCWNFHAGNVAAEGDVHSLASALLFAARRGVVVHAPNRHGAEDPFALQAARLYARLHLALLRGDGVGEAEWRLLDELTSLLPKPWAKALAAAVE